MTLAEATGPEDLFPRRMATIPVRTISITP
jgi:hypothetical protein